MQDNADPHVLRSSGDDATPAHAESWRQTDDGHRHNLKIFLFPLLFLITCYKGNVNSQLPKRHINRILRQSQYVPFFCLVPHYPSFVLTVRGAAQRLKVSGNFA